MILIKAHPQNVGAVWIEGITEDFIPFKLEPNEEKVLAINYVPELTVLANVPGDKIQVTWET